MEMRAIQVSQFGDLEVLKVETNVTVPVPTDTQVLVEVKSAGINPIDTFIRSGTSFHPPLPYTPGFDAAGIVKAVGGKVTKFKVGDHVYVIQAASGSYAEYTAVEENLAGHLPESLSFQQGAAVGLSYYTAFKALCIVAKDKIKPDNTVLIHGASGGVGSACVQIAITKGMKVFGTAGSPEGLEFVRKLGAIDAFNHKEEGYVDKIIEATGGQAPDLIIEMKSNVNLDADLKMINKHGLIVILGGRGRVEINPGLFMGKHCYVTGMAILQSTADQWTEMHGWVSEGMNEGWLVPHICKEYKLEEAAKAHHELINNAGAKGKRIFVM